MKDTDADAALVLYLTKADPLLVLRDLLGHSTVLTTEKYLQAAGHHSHLPGCLRERRAWPAGCWATQAAEREADAEFRGDDGGRI